MKIMLMKIKDGMIVASHIMATGIDLEIYSDIMGIIDTFGHAHYFHNVYPRCAQIHIMKIMCMTKSVIIRQIDGTVN